MASNSQIILWRKIILFWRKITLFGGKVGKNQRITAVVTPSFSVMTLSMFLGLGLGKEAPSYYILRPTNKKKVTLSLFFLLLIIQRVTSTGLTIRLTVKLSKRGFLLLFLGLGLTKGSPNSRSPYHCSKCCIS